jgi:cell pole-organizing protein PopZ
MGDMTKEPSMEEILSSIKRIIAEEGEEAMQAAPRRGRAAAAALPAEIAVPAFDSGMDEVLELTDEIVEEPVPAPRPTHAAAPAPTRAASAAAPAQSPQATKPQSCESAPDPASILSVESEIAARQSLSTLSSMLVAPRDGDDNTLDGLVRAMLRPMLKDWLDARLPSLVEEMVAKEIARITGR